MPRERLPHVGKATEKSAAWWLSAPLRSNARFFCKTDDDSLVHLSHLRSALLASLEQAGRAPNPNRPSRSDREPAARVLRGAGRW